MGNEKDKKEKGRRKRDGPRKRYDWSLRVEDPAQPEKARSPAREEYPAQEEIQRLDEGELQAPSGIPAGRLEPPEGVKMPPPGNPEEEPDPSEVEEQTPPEKPSGGKKGSASREEDKYSGGQKRPLMDTLESFAAIYLKLRSGEMSEKEAFFASEALSQLFHDGKIRRKSWQKETLIDQSVFESLCALQCPKREICDALHVSLSTLDRWLAATYGKPFSEVYDMLSSTGRIRIRRAQFRHLEKNSNMAIYLGKVVLGQREDQQVVDAKALEESNAQMQTIADLINHPVETRTLEDVDRKPEEEPEKEAP